MLYNEKMDQLINPEIPNPESIEKPKSKWVKLIKIILIIFAGFLLIVEAIRLSIDYYYRDKIFMPRGYVDKSVPSATPTVKPSVTDSEFSNDYINIPNTNLEIKIPTNFLNQPPSPSFYINLTPVLSFIKKGASITEGLNSLAISTVITPLSPKEWVEQNVAYQGMAWNESFGTGKEITINNLSFFSVDVACCGGYEQIYIYPINNMLVLFSTNDRQELVLAKNENEKSDRNIILDKIVATLRAKQ